jgi:hypothetical protein
MASTSPCEVGSKFFADWISPSPTIFPSYTRAGLIQRPCRQRDGAAHEFFVVHLTLKRISGRL